MFSAELPVLFSFVQVFGYLGTLEKSQKIILKNSIPEASTMPKGGHRAARGHQEGCMARPSPDRARAMHPPGWVPHPLGPYLRHILTPPPPPPPPPLRTPPTRPALSLHPYSAPLP